MTAQNELLQINLCMASLGPAANKRVWASSQCDTRGHLSVQRLQRYWQPRVKNVVIILENGIHLLCQTSSVKRLSRWPTHLHNPNSWPAITTWHCSNTFTTPTLQQTNLNPHYIHLLRVLHSTHTLTQVRAKGLCMGIFPHPKTTTCTPHTQLLQPPTCVT